MNKLIPTLLIILPMACGKKVEAPTADKTDTFATKSSPGIPLMARDSIALGFVRSYKVFCDNRSQRDDIEWVEGNPILSISFKAAHRKLMEDAIKADPEIGLDFDPI